MAEETGMNRVKKDQQELKKSINELEKTVIVKKEEAGYAHDRELEDMIKVALRQNRKLSDKVDYLMDTLIEASAEEGEETLEQAVKSLAKSQIDLLEQIMEIRQKVESADTIKEMKRAQEENMKKVGQKLDELDRVLKTLPYSAQIKTIENEVNNTINEIRTLESLITTKAPEDIMLGVNLIKDDVDKIKNTLGGLAKQLDNIKEHEEDFAQIIPSIAAVGALQTKIETVDTNIENLNSLLKSGRIEDQKQLSEKLVLIKEDLKSLQQIRDLVDSIAKQNKEESGKVGEIIKEIREMGQDVEKMKNWVENYPIGDAQEISFIKERFMELEEKISTVKQETVKQPAESMLQMVKIDLEDLERTFETKRLEQTQSIQKEVESLAGLVENVEKKVIEIEKTKETEIEKEIDELHAVAKELGNKTKEKELEDHIGKLEKSLENVESVIKETGLTEGSKLSQLREDITFIKNELGKIEEHKISPEDMTKMIEKTRQLEAPDVRTVSPEHEEKLLEVRTIIQEKQGETENMKMKKAIGEQAKKAEELQKQMRKQGEMKKADEAVKEIREHAEEIISKEEKEIRDYLNNIPVGQPIKISDISKTTGVPQEKAKEIIKRINKENPETFEIRKQ